MTEPPEKRTTAYATGPRTRFILEATDIGGFDGPIEATGRVAVSVGGALLNFREGDLVEMRGWLSRPRGPRNPGDFDWASSQRRYGIRAQLRCRHPESIRRLRPADALSPPAILNRVRTQMRGLLLDDVFREGDPGEGVMAAMVLGERSAVSKAMNDVFIYTGNAHFLAASGLHVGLFSILVWWGLTRCLGVHYRTSTVIVALLLISFVMLAEPRPSILRAVTVGVLSCVAIYFRREYNSLNWLSCAAVIILLINPASLFLSAFQYSFLAVLGLLYMQPAVGRAIAAELAARNRFGAGWYFDRKSYAGSLVDRGRLDPLSKRGLFHRNPIL